MEATVKSNENSFCSDNARDWFDDFVAAIRTDQLKLETGLASAAERKIYSDIIFGDVNTVMSETRKISNKHYIRRIIYDLSKELEPSKDKIKKLAFSFNASSVLCWAVIPDDDESLEDSLIIAKSKVDAKYVNDGFSVSLTILEESDKVNVPLHYQPVIG